MTTTSSTRLESARSALASACSDVVDGTDADAVDGVPAAQVAAELGEGTGHVHFG